MGIEALLASESLPQGAQLGINEATSQLAKPPTWSGGGLGNLDLVTPGCVELTEQGWKLSVSTVGGGIVGKLVEIGEKLGVRSLLLFELGFELRETGVFHIGFQY
jgi:hypothetical protein